MGLFFKKKTKEYICPVCGKTDNYEFPVVIKDNQKLCKECTGKVAIDSSMLPFQSVDDIKEHFAYQAENYKLVQQFSTTREVTCSNAVFREDSKMQKWCFTYIYNGEDPNPTIYDYKDIIDYKLMVDDEIITKGGLGSAVAGGVMFGGVGAIVGSNIGKKTNQIVTSMKLVITLNHPYLPEIWVPFKTGDGVRVGDYTYNTYKQEADQVIFFFDSLCAKAAASATVSQSSATSSADEILKFKNLLDAGIISQEEFDAKKKQLLGL